MSLESTLQNLDVWVCSPAEDAFPYRDVVQEFRRCGKHFVNAALLSKLSRIRSDVLPALTKGARAGGAGGVLKAFLDVTLDKHDGTYNYTTYIAVDLLGLPAGLVKKSILESSARLYDATVVSLICDALQFDLRAVNGESDSLPEMRPDATLCSTRIEVGMKAIGPALRRLGFDDPDGVADDPARITEVLDFARRGQCAISDQILEMTMLPVYVIHDEYMFIRLLQSLETMFAWIVVHLEAASVAFRTSPHDVVSHLKAATAMLKEGSRSFLLLSTMRKKAFETFRTYTEGASAIQSLNYKRMESMCRVPDEGRLESVAYSSVPRVQKLVARATRCRSLRSDSYTTLDDARLEALEDGRLSSDQDREIEKAMSQFATALRSWKFAHYSIAMKMLGRTTGTGYTEGTPYLKDVRDIPIFTSLTERTSP